MKVIIILLAMLAVARSAEEGDFCVSTAQCPDLFWCTDNICQHKPLFPITIYEVLGILYTAALVGFAQAGGIGGGEIITPNLIFVLKYNPKQAINMNFLFIFFGSLGSYIRNSQIRTEQGLPAVHYDLTLTTLPVLISGTVIGVALNHLLPSILICVIQVCILGLALKKTYKKYKAVKQQQEEQKALLLQQQMYAQNQPLEFNNANRMSKLDMAIYKNTFNRNTVTMFLNQIYVKERRAFPLDKLFRIFYMIGISVVILLIKGGKGTPSLVGIPPCGMIYWVLNCILFILTGFWQRNVINDISQYEDYKEHVGFDFEKFGQKYTNEQIIFTTKISTVAGTLGGFLGIGGGIILTPVWLEMGIPTIRAQSTSTFTVLFTSFMSLFVTFMTGFYKISEILFVGFLAFFTTYGVCGYLRYVAQKRNNQAMLIQILVYVMIFAIILMPYMSVLKILSNFTEMIELGEFC